MRLHTLTFLLLLMLATTVQAQEVMRLELPWKSSEELPIVIPADESGVMVFRENTVAKVQGRQWEFAFFDTTLVKAWETRFEVSKRMELTGFEYMEDKLYMLFHSERDDLLEVIRVYPEDGTVSSAQAYTVNKLEITDFEVLFDEVYVAGIVRNTPLILRVDTQNKRSQVMPSAFGGKQPKVTEMYASAQSGSVNVVLTMVQQKREAIVIRSYKQGDHQDFVIVPEPEYDLLNGKVAFSGPDMQVVIGTYSYKNSENTQGFYYARFEQGEQVETKYHSFTSLGNFFSFMDERNEARMKARVARRNAQGKDLRLKYRLLIHDLLPQDDGFVMLAEAYFPVYVSRTYSAFPNGWRPGGRNRRGRFYNQPRLVFDGYRYTHAVLASIDMSGEIKWDHAFEIDQVKTYTLKEQVRVTEDAQPFSLVYMLNDQIHYTTLQEDEVLISAATDQIRSSSEDDLVKRTERSTTDYWYGRYFLAYGYQKIKNTTDASEVRKVFFINKLKY